VGAAPVSRGSGQADIRAAQAAVDAAQLNLDFTKVTAPIDGRASRR
jgi:multidrug efflux system membrane fusion protein